MKIIKFFILLSGLISNAYAQNSSYTVSGTRFLLPLFEDFNSSLEKEGFSKLFKAIPRNPKADINATATPSELPSVKDGYQQYAIAKIVYIPVVNKNHPEIERLLREGIRVNELKNIFFKTKSDNQFKPTAQFNVLTRSACAAVSFSSFLKEDVKTIVNDYDKIENDSLLVDLVSKDTLGITFLDPSNIYDVKTGEIKTGFTVLPIDLNNNGVIDEEENFYANRSTLIQKLSTSSIDLPSGLLAITISEKENDLFAKYVQWIKEKGSPIIENFGFLALN